MGATQQTAMQRLAEAKARLAEQERLAKVREEEQKRAEAIRSAEHDQAKPQLRRLFSQLLCRLEGVPNTRYKPSFQSGSATITFDELKQCRLPTGDDWDVISAAAVCVKTSVRLSRSASIIYRREGQKLIWQEVAFYNTRRDAARAGPFALPS